MRKTRSQTQAEAAMANAGRTSNNTTATVSSTDNNSNNQQSINASSRSAAAASSNIQVATVSGMKRGPQTPDHFKIKECEEMVNLLRVVELQQILSFLSISFAGRKIDLQQRIINLLHSNYDLLSHKIREVYTQSIAEQQAQYGPTDPKRMYSHMQMPPVQQNPAAGLPQPGQQQAPVGAQSMAGVPPNGPGGGVANNMVPFMNPIPTHIPIHPDVRLKKLAFYDVLGILIKPSSLVPRNTQRIQEVPFYFTLTPQQATEIASNRDIRNSNKIEHAIQVQLRFCLLETSCEQEDCFPPSVSVKVNNKLCQLPNVIPTNRPNVEPKRPPRPVNVTANVKLSPTVTNTITVQWCPDYTRGYCIAVYLVKKLTSAQLLHRMKTKGVKPADYTRGLIKEKLTEDADCEIATTMLKVSLNCPLGKMKMSIPCRASTCSHLQCFDASLFLQMNERKPTWNCPVCDKPAIYDNLVIDGYFQEVLASSLLKPDDVEIQLHKDGSWSTHSLRNEAQIIDTPTKPVEKVEVISDDIEVITTEDVKMVKSAQPAPAIANDQPTSTTTNDTVDLTLSDSDDDMPLAKRRPALKQSAAANAANSAVSTSNINGNGNSNATGNGGNGNANNQRNAFAQQQRTDTDAAGIISLDSPSPPNSPAHSDRAEVNARSCNNDPPPHATEGCNSNLETPTFAERLEKALMSLMCEQPLVDAVPTTTHETAVIQPSMSLMCEQPLVDAVPTTTHETAVIQPSISLMCEQPVVDAVPTTTHETAVIQPSMSLMCEQPLVDAVPTTTHETAVIQPSISLMCEQPVVDAVPTTTHETAVIQPSMSLMCEQPVVDAVPTTTQETKVVQPSREEEIETILSNLKVKKRNKPGLKKWTLRRKKYRVRVKIKDENHAYASICGIRRLIELEDNVEIAATPTLEQTTEEVPSPICTPVVEPVPIITCEATVDEPLREQAIDVETTSVGWLPEGFTLQRPPGKVRRWLRKIKNKYYLIRHFDDNGANVSCEGQTVYVKYT